MATVPAACPYCGVGVTHVHPEQRRVLPDERERVPPQRSGGVEGEAVSLRRFSPCGHSFRTDDIQKWRDGEISPRELGDRVQNPRADDS